MQHNDGQLITFARNDGKECPGYLVGPQHARVGFVVIQEWWGMNTQIKDLAKNSVASRGYRALVPDLYRGKVATDHEEAGHLMGDLDWQGAVADIRGAATYLKSHGAAKVVVMGFCMGGALTLASSALFSDAVDAGVCFYGIPSPQLADVATTKIPLQLHFGNLDDIKGFSDSEAVDALEVKLKSGGVSYEAHRYENAHHAFMNETNPHYDAGFAARVWEHVFAFVAKHLSVQIHVFENITAVSAATGEFIARLSAEAIRERGRFTVAFSGGSLPGLVAPGLTGERKSSIQWDKWHVFFSDERYVSPEDKDSNFKACNDAIFSHVGIPEGQIYRLDHSVPLEGAGQKYQANLEAVFGRDSWPAFDLILLGMGPDGHTCSLFPFHALLHENEKWIAAISDSPKPPPQRITFTLPLVNNARSCAFVATGDAKKEILAQVLEKTDAKAGELPCQLVHPRDGQLHWFIDAPAAALLRHQHPASL